MSRSHFPERDAAAARLLGILAEYEQEVGQLVLTWDDEHDWALYARVSSALDHVRNLCGAQPALSLQFLELLISHVELMHMLCRAARSGERPALPERYADHLACITTLRGTCRGLLAGEPRSRTRGIFRHPCEPGTRPVK